MKVHALRLSTENKGTNEVCTFYHFKYNTSYRPTAFYCVALWKMTAVLHVSLRYVQNGSPWAWTEISHS